MSDSCDPTDCSLQGSSIHGISQARILSGLPFPSPGNLPDLGIEPAFPALQAFSYHWATRGYVYVYMLIKIYTVKHKFILMVLIPVHYHRVYFILPLSLFVTIFSGWNTAFIICNLFICSTTVLWIPLGWLYCHQRVFKWASMEY